MEELLAHFVELEGLRMEVARYFFEAQQGAPAAANGSMHVRVGLTALLPTAPGPAPFRWLPPTAGSEDRLRPTPDLVRLLPGRLRAWPLQREHAPSR